MYNETMPIGQITYFEGDILEFKEKPFGFFEVDIEAPKDLKIPLLQLRYKINNGYRTISPLGN
jgi:hypothetical protein